MDFPKKQIFVAHGYSDFFDNVYPQLDKICSNTQEDDGHLQIAIVEAVNNAARYSLDGLERADIHITLNMHLKDMTISISSKTKPWDVKQFVRGIKVLAQDDNWRNKDFGEYKGDRLSGRGIWLMLEACDYLYIDTKTNTVTMAISYPYKSQFITQKIGVLASRLYIIDNGVICRGD